MDAKEIGKHMKVARKAVNLTQKELAEKIGRTQKYISDIECGHKIPEVMIFGTIAKNVPKMAGMILDVALDCMETYWNGEVAKAATVLPECERPRFVKALRFPEYRKIQDQRRNSAEHLCMPDI